MAVFSSTQAPPFRSLQISDVEFVVVDVETTGLSPARNRMTEIAVVKAQDGEIIDRFSSLINPHQFIPSEIEALTGITNDMVYAAPDEKEVIPDIDRRLHDAVLVGHNVKFDRRFVEAAMKRVGFTAPDIPDLCTVRLARRLLPMLRSKSLGNVARHLGIRNSSRHRAAGDCETTAKVLIRFLQILEEEFEITEVGELLSFQYTPVSRYNPPPHRIRKLKPKLRDIPPVPGIYRFHDSGGHIIYVGKAKSLKDRVNSYFYSSGSMTRKVAELVRVIHNVSYETTETELSALLLESKEIKRLQPRFNTELKRYRKYPFLWIDHRNAFPKLGWTYDVEDDGMEYFGPFSSRRVVEATLDIINKLFQLRECDGSIHPDSKNSPCLYHGMKRCGAPCAKEQTPDEYAAEVRRVIQFLRGKHGDVLESLTNLMEKRSQELRFEAAAEIRDRLQMLRRVIRQQEIMAHSIREQYLLILTPALKTRVEVHLVKCGRVVWRDMINQARPKVSAIMKQVGRFFTNGQRELFRHTIEDINEMRIIATYCLSHREESVLLSIDNEQPLRRDMVAEAIESVGRN